MFRILQVSVELYGNPTIAKITLLGTGQVKRSPVVEFMLTIQQFLVQDWVFLHRINSGSTSLLLNLAGQ